MGDKDVAPPGVVWSEEGTHKGCPYGDSKSSPTRYEYMVLRNATLYCPRGRTSRQKIPLTARLSQPGCRVL